MNLFDILFRNKKPTICVRCEHCTSNARCTAHPYPVEIDLVTGRQKRFKTRYDPPDGDPSRVYTTELHPLCRDVNNGRCRDWTARAFGPVTITAEAKE